LRVQPPFAKRQSGFNTTVATLPSGRLTVSVIARSGAPGMSTIAAATTVEAIAAP